MTPLRDQVLSCVECSRPLLAHESGGRHWARCEPCGGIWMEAAQFLSLLREAQPDKAVDELMIHNDGSPRHPCPVCGKKMDLAWLDFLCLDQCERHGVWFEGGELEKALSWQVSRQLVGLAPTRKGKAGDDHDQQVAVIAVIAMIAFMHHQR